MSFDVEIYNAGIAGGMPVVVAQLLVAQAKHETANFTSAVFKVNNNAFGYKYVGQSGAWQGSKAPASEGGYYAAYAKVGDSAKEVVNWWKRRMNEGKVKSWEEISTMEGYAEALKRCGYYGDSLANYTAGLRRWFSEIPVASILPGAILFALALIFLAKRL